jgi:biopolymer transport protein ExbD
MALRKKSFGGRSRKFASSCHLNLTPFIDTLVVLLIFLVMSYSTSPSYLTPTQGIELSKTTSKDGAPDKPALIIGKDGLLLNGRVLVSFESGVPSEAYMDQVIVPELQEMLERVKGADENFTGTLILQADKGVPYTVLKPVLRTAGAVGFYDIKLAGMGID